jgi:hypothetical protein
MARSTAKGFGQSLIWITERSPTPGPLISSFPHAAHPVTTPSRDTDTGVRPDHRRLEAAAGKTPGRSGACARGWTDRPIAAAPRTARPGRRSASPCQSQRPCPRPPVARPARRWARLLRHSRLRLGKHGVAPARRPCRHCCRCARRPLPARLGPCEFNMLGAMVAVAVRKSSPTSCVSAAYGNLAPRLADGPDRGNRFRHIRMTGRPISVCLTVPGTIRFARRADIV